MEGSLTDIEGHPGAESPFPPSCQPVYPLIHPSNHLLKIQIHGLHLRPMSRNPRGEGVKDQESVFCLFSDLVYLFVCVRMYLCAYMCICVFASAHAGTRQGYWIPQSERDRCWQGCPVCYTDPGIQAYDCLTSIPPLHLQNRVFNRHPKVSLIRLMTMAILRTRES